MRNLPTNAEQQGSFVWQRFQEVVDPMLLTVPRLHWEQVSRKLMNYVNTHAAGTPWVNHLAFVLAVSICHARLDVKTVENRLQVLHRRWTTIFQAYSLVRFTQWDPAQHLLQYLDDERLEDTFETRQDFLKIYTASCRSIQVYLHSLPPEDLTLAQQWELPPLPTGLRQHLYRHRELQETRVLRRKTATDAVTPHFARIRGEGHTRWNELHRLLQKYREVVALVESGKAIPPVAFSYAERRRAQRLHFQLWDRASFVLAHADQYSARHICDAHHCERSFSPSRNHFFLEFLGADNLADSHTPCDPDTLLWFGDLLRYGVLGTNATSGTAEEVQRKQSYLRSWGYDTEQQEREPFNTDHPGLLSGSHVDGTAEFMDMAKLRTPNLVLMVEPLFAAATFGLAALDFFTTTGARIGELLQLSLSPDCLYTMEVGGIQRLLVKLVPKGKDKPVDYMIGPETSHNLERVAQMLREHYQLQPGGYLPQVPFNPSNGRSHQFPECRPYLFQYNGAHLLQKSITACMRFLCHGMIFQSADGNLVVLKAHLLRHVFATHLREVEHVPLDIIAAILHQKDIQVTGYYAAPSWQRIVETTDSLLDHFATHLGSVEDAFVRAPAELQRQWETAKERVGTLAKVPGGDCSCHAICPFSYVCTGCVYKVPDPSRRDEIVEQKQWAMIRLDQVKRRAMGPEIVKLQALIQRCNTELEEMTIMEEYRNDEQFNPPIHIEPASFAKARASLAETVPSSQATTDRRSGQSGRRSIAQRRANGHA
jgi:hypothetical protein